jgi:peptide/nickel transport system substrate-binding protein
MYTQKKLFITALVLIIGVWILINFVSPMSEVATAGLQPVKGGILKAIRGSFPKVLGYPPEQGPTDTIFALLYAERLSEWDEKGNLIPVLAESWEGDPKNKTVTYHLRKGVKFHDGTPFNAEAVRWNLQTGKDTGRLTDGQFVKSIEVLDEYTVRLNCTEYTSVTLLNYGWLQQYSPTAFNTRGGKEWARTNAIGTGPFKLVEFKRDAFIKYKRNDEYWRKDLPYLDGMEVRYVPDPVTASMMMEAKEADIWLDISNVTQIVDLEKKGFKINWGPGMLWALLPANAKDPKSPYANKKVREAVEYAIDRPAIAKTLGFGKFEPLTQIVPSYSPAYNPNYNPRPYNPEKAKQLLAEAGYPNGFETKLLVWETSRDAAIAIQTYLNAVGINVTLDLSDMSRYFASVFSPAGWTDLVLAASGINPDATDIFTHFGPRPMTYRFGFIAKSPEFLASCEKALKTYEPVPLKRALQDAVKQASEDALIIPLWRSAQVNVMRDYVHTDYINIHSVTWYSYQDWIEKRK